jgi:hypothetical protein
MAEPNKSDIVGAHLSNQKYHEMIPTYAEKILKFCLTTQFRANPCTANISGTSPSIILNSGDRADAPARRNFPGTMRNNSLMACQIAKHPGRV